MPERVKSIGAAALIACAVALCLSACKSPEKNFSERHVEVLYTAKPDAGVDPQGADLVFEIQWFRRKYFTDPQFPGEEYEVARVGPGPADDHAFQVTFTPVPAGDLAPVTQSIRTDGAGILRVAVPAEVKAFGKTGAGCRLAIEGEAEGTPIPVAFEGSAPSFSAEQLVELLFTGR